MKTRKPKGGAMKLAARIVEIISVICILAFVARAMPNLNVINIPWATQDSESYKTWGVYTRLQWLSLPHPPAPSGQIKANKSAGSALKG